MKIVIRELAPNTPFDHHGEMFPVVADCENHFRYRCKDTGVIYGIEKKYCDVVEEKAPLKAGNLDAYENFNHLIELHFPEKLPPPKVSGIVSFDGNERIFTLAEARYIFNKGINTGIYRCTERKNGSQLQSDN